jgi:glucokinase
MYYIGVDIGGTTIKAGLVDETGRILEQTRVPTIVDNWDAFLESLVTLIGDFQKAHKIIAAGVGVPGLRNSRTRRIVVSPNIPCLTNVSLENLLADKVHLPVVTENDANAAAYAEFVCGFGIGVQHMAYLTLGTGLGSGVILNGKLFGGASGYAVEFGHVVVQPHGRPCGCGSRGCLETLVSAPGILMTALDLMETDLHCKLRSIEEPLTAELIFEAAVAGDSVAKATFDRTGEWLGIACANLINMLNLELIVLGGGVMAAGDTIMTPLLDAARRHSIAAPFADCRIVQSKLWPEAGVVGAAMLARDNATN